MYESIFQIKISYIFSVHYLDYTSCQKLYVNNCIEITFSVQGTLNATKNIITGVFGGFFLTAIAYCNKRP